MFDALPSVSVGAAAHRAQGDETAFWGLVARERSPGYERDAHADQAGIDDVGAGAAGLLAVGLEQLQRAVDALGAADPWWASDDEVARAAAALQERRNQLDAAWVRILGELDQRELHRRDGAAAAHAWLRERTGMDHGRTKDMVEAAGRLRELTLLREAFTDGAVSLEHVLAVTKAAIPRRMRAIAENEATLVELARTAPPHAVRVAVARIRDHVDPDGADAEPLDPTGRDERRELHLRRGYDDLWDLDRSALDPVAGEKLAALLDHFDVPDPADIPPAQRRSAAQRRADALEALCDAVLAAGLAPTKQGQKPHVAVTMDLATLLGDDDAATRRPRLRYWGELSPQRARMLALGAQLTVLLTMGPWRVVNVGRTMRTLPGWLKAVLIAMHRRCRGPDCRLPAVWTESHHEQAWADGGETDLDHMIPVCKTHHQMITLGGWHAEIDPDTAICTWTSPTGSISVTHPPAP